LIAGVSQKEANRSAKAKRQQHVSSLKWKDFYLSQKILLMALLQHYEGYMINVDFLQ